MTRIDFYVLSDGNSSAREQLACRLAEIAYRRGQQVYLYAQDLNQAKALDALLWTFQAGSFVPHDIYPSDNHNNNPVLIGYDNIPEHSHEVLINLSEVVPGFFSRFERVAEIVNQEETVKQAGRQRFRFYRDRGYPLSTHNLNAQPSDA